MCRMCGYNSKELYNCTLSWSPDPISLEGRKSDISVMIMLCVRCMRRVGLKARKTDEKGGIYGKGIEKYDKNS